MESTDGGEFKSGILVGIIGTACLFCVAGTDWWMNYKNLLLVDVVLRHEINETREAERYKFGDGGTLTGLFHQSNRPHCDGWSQRQNCVQRGFLPDMCLC